MQVEGCEVTEGDMRAERESRESTGWARISNGKERIEEVTKPECGSLLGSRVQAIGSNGCHSRCRGSVFTSPSETTIREVNVH